MEETEVHTKGILIGTTSDGITDVRFSDRDSLFVASWDKNVHYFGEDYAKRKSIGLGGPVLGCDPIRSGAGCVAACLDTSVTYHDLETDRLFLLGTHGDSSNIPETAGASCVRSLKGHASSGSSGESTVVSGGYDSMLKIWDMRVNPLTNRCGVSEIALPGKCYSLSLAQNVIISATQGRKIVACDLRTNSVVEPLSTTSTSLSFQPRCVEAIPDGSGYSVGSVEGKVAIQPLENAKNAIKSFSFKCHRKTIDQAKANLAKGDNNSIAYPVNCLCYHPVYHTLLTGGSDGFINVWDWRNKKRIYQFAKFGTTIASMHINAEGRKLAIASSYMFEHGDLENREPDQVYIRYLNENEIVPKSRH